jgi:hypothetical protein
MGYEIARRAAKGHPMLLDYLDAMEIIDNYNGIACMMGIDVREVMRLEKQLLDLLAKM